MKVKITGHPPRYEWMRALVGKKAEVIKSGRIMHLRLDPFDDFYIGSAYVEAVEDEKEGAA